MKATFKIINSLIVTIIALLPAPSFAYFKCTDDQGAVSFQALPCPQESIQLQEPIRGEHKSPDEKSQASATTSIKSKLGDSEFIADAPALSTESTVLRAKLSAVIGSLATLKILVTQFHAANNKWPGSLSEVGISESAMTSRYIDDIQMVVDGTIAASLNAEFGVNKRMLIKPKTVLDGTSIEWQCFANFTKQFLNSSGTAICQSRNIE